MIHHSVRRNIPRSLLLLLTGLLMRRGGGGKGGGLGGLGSVGIGVRMVEGLSCVGQGPCGCVFDDGSGTIDISSLGNRNGTPRFQDVKGGDQLFYSYNPCHPFSEGNCSQAAVCKVDKRSPSVSYQQIGDARSVKWLNNAQTYQHLKAALSGVADHSGLWKEYETSLLRTGLNVTAYYEHDEGFPLIAIRESFVTYLCDPQAVEPTFDALGGDGTQTYFFRLKTQCACPNGCVKKATSVTSLSAGSVLLIILFVTLSVYLTGGVLVNRVRHQSTGLELLPHAHFWRNLPAVIKDGFLFVSCQFRRSQQTYTEVE